MEYYVEKRPSPIEAKLFVHPNLYEPQTKKPEINIEYVDIRRKYYASKEVVDFANTISSRMSNWKLEIIWFTENGKIINGKIIKRKSVPHTFYRWVT